MKMRLILASVSMLLLLLAGSANAEIAASKSATTTEQQKSAKTDKPRLSDEKFKTYKDAMNKARYDGKHISEQIKAKRKEMAALLSAEKFDKAAYLAKHDEMQALIDKTARLKAEAMASIAEKFSAADRKILAERFDRKRGERGKNHNGKRTAEPIRP